VGMGPVLPEETALPGPEEQLTLIEGNGLRGAGEGHFYVAGHVVGAFVDMLEMRIVLLDQPIEPIFEIAASRGVRVFHEDEAATGMATENGDRTGAQTGFLQDRLDETGYFDQAFAPCCEGKGLLVDLHRSRNLRVSFFDGKRHSS
jgi:hypothetical protein